MKKLFLRYVKSGLLFILLALSVSKASGQGIPYSVWLNRMDSTSVSGYFITYLEPTTHFIHYNIDHDTVAQTVDVQISCHDSVHFNIYVLDTGLHYAHVAGGVNNSTYNVTLNVSTFHPSPGYLVLRFVTDFVSPTYLYLTSFK